MGSAEEIYKCKDHQNDYCSSKGLRKTLGTSYDFSPKKSPKKEKKWSLGSLFRRKKKSISESTSEEELENKKFLQRKKKKPDKRKSTNKTAGFDHVVVPHGYRQNTLLDKTYDDSINVLSEPTYSGNNGVKNFIPASDYTCKLVPLNDCKSDSGSTGKRSKKVVLKARAEARRDTSKGEDSSDEDSYISAFKSDESLTKHKEGLVSRKSRAARTQRYLRRRSKDEEGSDQIRVSDLEYDNSKKLTKLANERSQNPKPTSSPILSSSRFKACYANSTLQPQPNSSGLCTIPPSHSGHRYRTINLANNHLHKQSASFRDSIDVQNFNSQRSQSCGANIHKTISPENEIIHGQFSLGNPFHKHSNRTGYQKNIQPPPPPPPRDPRRVLSVQNSDGRPISYCFENTYRPKNEIDPYLNKPHAVNNANNISSNCRSTSEDHISSEPLQRITLVPRPSSANPETNKLQKIDQNNYRYATDKNPRSRKPIAIHSCNQTESQNNSQTTFDFWKQKDEEVARSNLKKSATSSPLMFTSQTHLKTNIFLPNGCKIETEYIPSNPTPSKNPEANSFRPITPTISQLATKTDTNSYENELEQQRKSSNLEDALDELEKIYNSLHLGDEDLLERAEQREAAAAKMRRDAALESYPEWRDDPCFEYDSPRRKRSSKMVDSDRRTDDMAFRKLNKHRYNTINNPQSVVSGVSYLLTSPVYNGNISDSGPSFKIKSKGSEPDVTFDDVVYRNVTQSNNTLKTVDPQPPFGIPIGPILPAANSDYLHATPEINITHASHTKATPDVVKDDLAYRNLRKDNKEPALRTRYYNNSENNNNSIKSTDIKRNRAVRSMSANIFNLMHGDLRETKEQNIDDVANALEVARYILKEKENNIIATNKAFLSDGEFKYTNPPSCNEENVYHHRLQVSMPVVEGDRLETKPPTPDRSGRSSKPSTKESTPIPSTSSEDIQLKRSFQEAALNRQFLDVDNNNLEVSDESYLNPNRKLSPQMELDNPMLNLTLSEDVLSSEHARLCEKLLECVTESTELLNAELSEEVSKIDPICVETVANIVLTPSDKSNVRLNMDSIELYSESDHDYVNIESSDDTQQITKSEEKSTLDKKRFASEQASDEESKWKQEVLREDGITNMGETARKGGEQCVNMECIALPTKVPALRVESHVNSDPNQNHLNLIEKPKREEHLNIFPSSMSSILISPKLVQNLEKVNRELLLNKTCAELNDDSSDNSNKMSGYCDKLDSGSSRLRPLQGESLQRDKKSMEDLNKKGGICEGFANVHQQPLCSRQPDSKDASEVGKMTGSWYEDSAVIALACSCGIACMPQLPFFDIVAILGLVFAIISMIIISLLSN